MSKLNIIRASAGSGKTYRLISFFLEIVLKENPDYFKSILGVTFTNKATEEMKRRIIEQLYLLCDPEQSDYPEDLLVYFRGNKDRLREKSVVLLKRILHEYSWFSIETIDTFFQRVIRAFTRELGIPGNYTIEIDTQPILKYAVDQVLDTLEENTDRLTWLMQFAENKIAEGKSWDIQNSLLTLGYEVFREEYATGSSALQKILTDRDKLYNYRNNIFMIMAKFEKRCREIGQKGLKAINESELTTDDFYQKRNGALRLFTKLQQCELRNTKGELITQTRLAKRLLEDAQNWPSNDTMFKSEVSALASHQLLPLLHEITAYIEREYLNYFTAEAIRKNLYTVGILVDLEEQIRQYRLEKNVFILSDAPKLIDRIINHNDTPFIYEKMGNRYRHFLIDEFQDTSKLQWGNFKPLISNSLSQGKECLLVGDVKQSVYRWRNSDWYILARNINTEYPENIIREIDIDINWRSGENLVVFNNRLFHIAQEKIREQLQQLDNGNEALVKAYQDMLFNIYANISQTVPELYRNRGYVQIRFFHKQTTREKNDYYINPLIDSINKLLESGYIQGEIAILVRNRKEGKLLADLLITKNNESAFYKPVEVISDESLFLSASNAANLLIAALQYLNSPDESLYRAKLMGLYKAHISGNPVSTEINDLQLEAGFFDTTNITILMPSEFIRSTKELSSLPLYDLAERLTDMLQLCKHKTDVPYVLSLLDLIHEYSYTNTAEINGFLEYWDEEGNTKSIPATESDRAIRILTIHKAKGLEFRAVMVPFCYWDLTQKPNTIFWTHSPEAPFDYLPVIPLNFTKSLKDTHFRQAYFDELFKSYIDNLNLLYVAFTRAIDALIAFPVFSNNDSNNSGINTVGDLLYECITSVNKSETNYFNSSQLIYEKGSITDKIAIREKLPSQHNSITVYTGKPAIDRMYFNASGFEYFHDTENIKNRRIRGKVLHNLLANIITISDLETSVQEAVSQGLISMEEGKSLKEHIKSGMLNARVKKWFDGTGEVLTERDILLPHANSKRPDRIVIWNHEAHVIDYKFSSEKRDTSYQRQIEEYMELISKIEAKPVKGFIWYVDKNEIVELGK